MPEVMKLNFKEFSTLFKVIPKQRLINRNHRNKQNSMRPISLSMKTISCLNSNYAFFLKITQFQNNS
jgi:hypothetical protein